MCGGRGGQGECCQKGTAKDSGYLSIRNDVAGTSRTSQDFKKKQEMRKSGEKNVFQFLKLRKKFGKFSTNSNCLKVQYLPEFREMLIVRGRAYFCLRFSKELSRIHYAPTE